MNLYRVDFLQHDVAGMERDAAETRKLGQEDGVLVLESDNAAYAGQFIKARELMRRAANSAPRADEARGRGRGRGRPGFTVYEKQAAANRDADVAEREALVGNIFVARQQAQAALALSRDAGTETAAAIALGLAGDSVQAVRIAHDLDKRFPKATLVQFQYLPVIRASSLLGHSDPKNVLALLSPTERYGLASFSVVYLRGEAYLAGHQGAAAASEFQKILDRPGNVLNNERGSLAHLGLGRAYALDAAADPAARDKARKAYEDFLTLWKDADPDIPILKEAKAEYAKLQ
jgi:hypothetical protein